MLRRNATRRRNPASCLAGRAEITRTYFAKSRKTLGDYGGAGASGLKTPHFMLGQRAAQMPRKPNRTHRGKSPDSCPCFQLATHSKGDRRALISIKRPPAFVDALTLAAHGRREAIR